MRRLGAMLKVISITLPILGVAFVSIVVLAQDVGESVARRGTVADDYYAAGGNVEVRADVRGDVVVAGGSITVDADVDADMLFAGGDVNVRGVIGDDVRGVGGMVSVDARVAGDVMVAGSDIRIGPDTDIRGRLWVAGNQIEVAGNVGKELRAAADVVKLSGHIGGDVLVQARSLEIMPGAHIEGNVHYTSIKEANVSRQAQIDGAVSQRRVEWQPPNLKPIIPLLSLTAAFTGIVFYLLFPAFTIAAARNILSYPWRSLGLGVVGLIVTPIAAILLMATVVGLWIGLITLALYFIALAIGFLLGVFFVAQGGARLFRFDIVSKWRQVGVLLVAFIVVALIQWIPFAGPWVSFILLLLGLGSGMLQIHQVYRTV